MFKYVLAGVLAIGVLAIGGRIATQALFTDTQSVGANTFTAGTVDISSSAASAMLTLSTMAPGTEVNSPITITNAGSLQLRYAVQRQRRSGVGQSFDCRTKGNWIASPARPISQAARTRARTADNDTRRSALREPYAKSQPAV